MWRVGICTIYRFNNWPVFIILTNYDQQLWSYNVKCWIRSIRRRGLGHQSKVKGLIGTSIEHNFSVLHCPRLRFRIPPSDAAVALQCTFGSPTHHTRAILKPDSNSGDFIVHYQVSLNEDFRKSIAYSVLCLLRPLDGGRSKAFFWQLFTVRGATKSEAKIEPKITWCNIWGMQLSEDSPDLVLIIAKRFEWDFQSSCFPVR